MSGRKVVRGRRRFATASSMNSSAGADSAKVNDYLNNSDTHAAPQPAEQQPQTNEDNSRTEQAHLEAILDECLDIAAGSPSSEQCLEDTYSSDERSGEVVDPLEEEEEEARSVQLRWEEQMAARGYDALSWKTAVHDMPWHSEKEQIKWAREQWSETPKETTILLVLDKRTNLGRTNVQSVKFLLRMITSTDQVESTRQGQYVTIASAEIGPESLFKLQTVFRKFQEIMYSMPGSMLYRMSRSVNGEEFPQLGRFDRNTKMYATEPWHFVMWYHISSIEEFGTAVQFEKELMMLFTVAQTIEEKVMDQERALRKVLEQHHVPREDAGDWIYDFMIYDDEGLGNGFWHDDDGTPRPGIADKPEYQNYLAYENPIGGTNMYQLQQMLGGFGMF